MVRIVLASASPRRRELLAQIGLEFEIKVSDIEERVTAVEPCEVVQELAGQKAESVLRLLWEPETPGTDPAGREAPSAGEDGGLLVIGADTIVACDGSILGKPVDEADAGRMLRLLSGRSHEVYTGVALLYCPSFRGMRGGGRAGGAVRRRVFYERTTVHFAPMSEAEIEAYVSTKDPLDKAGAYGIQGFCARYITGIEGDYNNVVGLPVGRLYQEAKEWLA